MKKLFCFVAIALMIVGAVSCKKSQNQPDPVDDPTTVTPSDPEDDATQVTIARIQLQSLGSFIAYMLYDDESGKAFVFPVYLAEGADDIEYGKTYVFPGDMNPTYAYWMLSDYVTHALYKEASFTATEKSSGSLLIKARVLDDKGDKWALTYEE